MKLYTGDCIGVIPTLDPVDAIVTDPPYGLKFMGKNWDHGVPGIPYWKACLDVLKPGGYLLAFGGTRTFHRLTCAIEDAGFEIRDCIMWVYGSGLPKSLNVSKAIDKMRYDRNQILQVTRWIRIARDAAKKSNKDIDDTFGFAGMAGHWTSTRSQPAVPTLDQIPKLLDVLGIQLEDVPAEMRELIWALNGPKGKPGKNWYKREIIGEWNMPGRGKRSPEQKYGLTADRGDITADATDEAKTWAGWGTALKPAWEPIIVARKPLEGTVAANVLKHGTGAINIDASRVKHTEPIKEPGGRWPANLIHDGDQLVLDLFPETTTGKSTPGKKPTDSGSAARFFYCAKASETDRDPDNNHPTVKPTNLMRYLVRLVTPPGGTVLDPFTGSGSTGKAAILEGFDFIGIDLDPEYIEIAERRLARAIIPPDTGGRQTRQKRGSLSG